MLKDLWDWLASLPPDFAFLLALPIVVAIAGLASEQWRSRARRKRAGKRGAGGRDVDGVGPLRRHAKRH
jgi:hypothetical protein